ncbi:MAG: sulfatase-like hydrolase/transferase [Opitutaceae bacterium]|nr:sulfatase-like hydrolase/transferase [Opitutaceae bacterium]
MSAGRILPTAAGCAALLGASLLLPLRSPAAPPGPPGGERPNFVILLADDLGYADLGVMGGTDIPTPNLDALAKGGVRFTDGYVTCPVCAPSRAGLLTGRYPQRFGFETNPGLDAIHRPDTGLPATEETLASRLRRHGYATGLLGKWHLGSHDHLDPLSHGFVYFYGFRGGMRNYFPNAALRAGADPYFGAQSYLYDQLERNRKPVTEPDYLTDALAEEAVGFIERYRAQPYLLVVSFNAVHNPLQAPARYLARFPASESERRRHYAAMVSALDDAVGAILCKLESVGQARNTLVVFLSDNGGGGNGTAAHSANTGRNQPLRGFKFDLYEGGIRVPLLMRWPQRLPEGRVYSQPVTALDLFPTICAAAGVGLPEDRIIDGVDLLPFLSAVQNGAPHRRLYWRWTFRGGEAAMRRDDWKLVMLGKHPPQLYDLRHDVGEQHDLAPEYPRLVATLLEEWKAWSSQMAAPRW